MAVLTHATILMADFVQWSELEEVTPFDERNDALEQYQRDAFEVVVRNYGTLEKFTGDGLMAMFRGRARASDSVRAAHELIVVGRKALTWIQESSNRAVDIPQSGTSIGIASGDVAILLGVSPEINGAVIGLAERIRGNALADQIIICTTTYIKIMRSCPELMQGARSEVLSVTQLKGHRDPVKVWRLPSRAVKQEKKETNPRGRRKSRP
jgi:class 3 adenylate cyclase